MTAPRPRRAWYQRKRVWAAVALWLLLATYIAAYAALVRPAVVLSLGDSGSFVMVADYPHPALRGVFGPAEWIDRRVRPAAWKVVVRETQRILELPSLDEMEAPSE